MDEFDITITLMRSAEDVFVLTRTDKLARSVKITLQLSDKDVITLIRSILTPEEY